VLTYPINRVGWANRLCLVVGGGPVALRKVEGLLAAGASPRVVAPKQCGELAALSQRALVNVVDVPEESNFIVPAVVRRGKMSIAVSTGGGSPALSRRLRGQLEMQFGPEYELLVDLLAELRREVIARYAPGKPRLQAALRLVDAGLHRTIAERVIDAAREQARSLLGLV
jgi:precorrin-2 dehydrogenase / sirohydrochlorin ferrochelatase